MSAYDLVMCIIKCVLGKNYYKLKISPTLKKTVPWDILCYSDSDYVVDNDTRQSV